MPRRAWITSEACLICIHTTERVHLFTSIGILNKINCQTRVATRFNPGVMSHSPPKYIYIWSFLFGFLFSDMKAWFQNLLFTALLGKFWITYLPTYSMAHFKFRNTERSLIFHLILSILCMNFVCNCARLLKAHGYGKQTKQKSQGDV